MIDTTPAPLVSLIMSIHNSAATIESTIRSIIWQTYPNWELIVIDDGSRDDGAARVAKFCDPRIRVVRHDTSRPLGYRLNEAVALARGEFIARMDADDICYPERLTAQVGVLRSDPTIDLLASKALVFRVQGEIVGIMPAPKTHDEIVAYPYRGFMFLHPSWIGKAAWFHKHQYDDLLKSAEDQELLLRAAATSRFASIDKILLGYRKESLGLLSKSAYGRALYMRAILRQAGQSSDYVRAAADIALHFVKFATEVAASTIGAEQWLLRQKYRQSPSPEETAQWRKVWNEISGTQKN